MPVARQQAIDGVAEVLIAVGADLKQQCEVLLELPEGLGNHMLAIESARRVTSKAVDADRHNQRDFSTVLSLRLSLRPISN